MEAAVDAIRHVTHISGSVALERAGVAEILNALSKRMMVASSYLTMEGLWQECQWNDWSMFTDGDIDVFRATELRQAAVAAASHFRSNVLLSNVISLTNNIWKELPSDIKRSISNYRVVSRVSKRGRNWEISLRKLSLDVPPGAELMKLLAVEPWIDPYIDKPLPQQPELSIKLLLMAWDVIRSFASAVEANMPTDTSVRDLSQLWRHAPSFDRRTLEKTFMDALSVSKKVASRILATFSTSTTRNVDMWMTPFWDNGDVFHLI